MAGIPAVLLPSALDRLPPSIRRVAKAACALDSSLEDANALVEILNNTTESNLGQFLPVFFAFLHPSLIPTSQDLDVAALSFRNVHRVHSAQQALNAVYRLEIPAAAQSSLLSRAFAWLQFFLMFEEYLPTVAAFDAGNSCVNFIIFSQTLNEKSLGLMIASTRFFALVARAWNLLLTFEDHELQLLGLQCVFAFTDSLDEASHCREELIEGAGHTLDDLAALVAETISLIVASKDRPMSLQSGDLLDKVLDFVLKFDGLEPMPTTRMLPPLCAAMISQRLVERLTIALCALVETTITASVSSSALDKALLILAYIFLSPGGYRNIPDTAKTGFFRVVIAVGRRQLPAQHFKVILGQMFAPATVYYTVLSGISEAFREVEGLALSEPFRQSTVF
ncbi:hypothetical protein MSAN_01638200 [Mycena sanguinolenta]|uniref:Uncharacterized protein n=1 Tax=Mycena sanguinolenta TaxID=230812 RepID=A0A8H7CUI0_9AGAR|nr:hypothetical protein MSAN_01638200 [Mycena sanguinolenta]